MQYYSGAVKEVDSLGCVMVPTALINNTMEASFLSPKNTFSLPMRRQGPLLTVSSNFDSGNCAKAEIGLNHAIVITPAHDCSTSTQPSHSKGWFYFSVAGAPLHAKLKFIIKRMSPMASQLKFADYFRPVFRASGEEWQRIESAVVFTKEDDTQLHFDFSFPKASEVFFAYSYPFSYEDCEKMLRNVQKEAKGLKNIYYRDEVAIRTIQGRSVHLLTVSSHDDKTECLQDKISQHMFNHGERPASFKNSKRVVMVSARVHPGQAPSSHTFNGLIKFLLSSDARAFYLRKNFVFKLIPMLNPDGVFHGHYRMDTFAQNLNRFYLDPDPYKQPSVFVSKKLGQHYHSEKRLCFYVDLHAHPQKKGNFIYGNSMQNPQEQVETQLFARLLSMNCIQFDYFNSCFSKYHMNAKDRNEDLSKEGCGRVVFNTHFNLPYAYTMECGYTASNCLNEIASIANGHRKFEKHAILGDQMENIKSVYYSKKHLYFTTKSYENLGKNILVSILDLFDLNPASRLPHTPLKHLAGVRQDILEQINKASMAYNSSKLTKNPTVASTQGSIRSVKPARVLRGHFMRAPSIEAGREGQFGKVRNRTIAKVNIGQVL